MILYRLHFPVLCPIFLHNRHCHLWNQQYKNYFRWYHLHNLLYLEKVEMFYDDYLFLYQLHYPIVISFWGLLYLQLVPLLELNLLFFFSLFLHGISDLYSNILAKVSSCPDKTETLKLSLQISISGGFYILVPLLD